LFLLNFITTGINSILFMDLKRRVVVLVIIALAHCISVYAQKKPGKVLKEVYCINRDGAVIKQTPDGTSDAYAAIVLGQPVEIIKSVGDWWFVKAPDSEFQNGYVKKSLVSEDPRKIPLTNDDLSEVYAYRGTQLERFRKIKISLIPKQQFEAMKKASVDYFVADANVIKKTKRTLRLPIKNGFKTLNDTPDDSNTNTYVGQYPSLNKYVIINCDEEAESCYYAFIDKVTGNTDKETFGGRPDLSIDKKMIMALKEDDDRKFTYLQLNIVDKNSSKLYASCQCGSWIPAANNEQFWGNDGFYYAAVLPSAAFYYPNNAKEISAYNYRYIKIKILGPTPPEKF